MSDTKRYRSAGYVASVIVVLVSIAITLFLLGNRQLILDQVSVWQYQPSSNITSFANRTTMSQQGRFLFFASQPSLEGTQAFNDKCSRIEKSTAILGCYNGSKIYVYDVLNPKLDGIREVTAAHEMLHAAYQRMGDAERKSVDALVETEYAKLSNDSEFAERMAFYARTEPGERDNELHSIIGTEVGSVSPTLEAHYAKYFYDRSKVVALHVRYASVFAEVQSRNKELSAQLTALVASIEEGTVTYNREVKQLNADISDFNRRANNGEFATQAAFDNERSALLTHANNLEAMRADINQQRAKYDALREEMLATTSESEALNQSIDSTLAPAPSL